MVAGHPGLRFLVALSLTPLGFSQSIQASAVIANFSSRLPADASIAALQATPRFVQLAFAGRTAGILRGGPDGQSISLSPLPPGPIASAFFDDAGRLIVLRPGRDPQPSELLVFGLEGLVSRSSVDSGASAAVPAGGEVFLLRPDGRIGPAGSLQSRQPFRIPDLPERFYVAALNSRTIAIVDKHAPAAKIVDLVTATVRAVTLEDPSIAILAGRTQEIIRNAPPGAGSLATPLLFSDATGEGQGNLYLGLGSFAIDEGAPLLQLNDEGKRIRSLRLRLPSLPSERTAMNPEGLVAPRWLGVHGTTLVTASNHGVVAFYSLADETGGSAKTNR